MCVVVLPCIHAELALCHDHGPTIVPVGFRIWKNGQFLPTGEMSSSPY
jgi:hypothetical protein